MDAHTAVRQSLRCPLTQTHLYETQKLGLQQVFGFSFAEFALRVSSVVIHQRSSSNSFFKV